jgi:ATP-binding cassette subfamily F protein 3
MAIATLDNIEKTFGKRVLFENLDLSVYEGERIGLIGPNGSGKTTLFRVLTGAVVPDAGTVAIARGTKVGYLTQDPVFGADNTVMDEAELAFAHLHRLSHRQRDIEHEMAGAEGKALEKILRRYQTVQHEFELAGGYAWRHRLEATLQGVGLEPSSWEQAVSTLSGGQRSRLALAKLLISEPDLLLLDEPTNHLDLAATEWLEDYLLSFNGAVVLISHDRFLLDRLAMRIAWLSDCRIRSFPGNYSAFAQQRALQELTQQREYEKQQADIAKQQEFIRRFGAGQRSREAKGRQKRLNRLLKSDALVRSVSEDHAIRLRLDSEQRAGDQVLDVRALAKSYDGRTLWSDVAFHVRRGERIGLIGPNGAGKTTLLEVLLGMRQADGGQVRWGANLNIGYYDQTLDDFDPDHTVIEEAANGRNVSVQEVREVLAMLLFRGEAVDRAMGLLSGGERARVALAQLLLDRPNVLVLDEPTNHLDIASREALEGTLGQFSGTILCVSHDRYFLNRIVNRLLVLCPPEVVDFAGTYSAWAARVQAETAARAAAAPSPSPRPRAKAPTPQRDRRNDNAYLRPFGRLSTAELERQITDAELALGECQSAFGDADRLRDPAQARQLQAEYDALTTKLEHLEAEYYAREE